MKTLKAIKASLASLVIGLSASAFAGYDAEGGYVTLGIDEYSGSSGVSSLTTAGAWSDGRAPHSDTNYYAAGLGYYPGVFQGGRLVVRKLRPRGTPVSPQGSTGFTWEQLEANACVISNLVFEANDSSWICQFGSYEKFMFKGSMEILSRATFMPGHSAERKCGYLVIKMDVTGSQDTKMIFKADGGSAGETKYLGGTYMIGNTDAFEGSVEVQQNQTLFMGDWGFKNAKEVKLISTWATLDTYLESAKTVPVSKLVTSVAAKLIVPTKASLQVGTLDLAAGTVLCVSQESSPLSESGIVVHNDLVWRGVLKVDMEGRGALPRRTVRLLSVPTSVRALSPGDFDLQNVPEDMDARLVVETEGAMSVAKLERISDIPDLPDVMDETTGYVVMTNNDTSSGTVTLASLSSVGNWSDGQAPHIGTNYFSNGFYLRTSQRMTVFGGDRLVQKGTIRTAGGYTLDVADLLVLPNGETDKIKCTQLTTVGGRDNSYLKGKLALFTTEASPCSLIGGEYGHIWVVESKLVGNADAALLCCCHSTYTDPSQEKCHFGVDLKGDCSDYFGKVMVDWCCTFRLGAGGLPKGTLVINNPSYGKVTALEPADVTIPVKCLVAEKGANIEPLAGNVFEFGSINASSNIVKTGAGTLAAAGTATVGENVRLEVRAGYLQALSEDAFNGFGIDFADGAGLSMNVTNGCPVKTSQSVAVSGTVNVKVLGAEGEYTGGTVVLARVPTANASALASAMVVGRVRGFKVSAPVVGAADGQGLSPISVNIEKQGLVIEIF